MKRKKSILWFNNNLLIVLPLIILVIFEAKGDVVRVTTFPETGGIKIQINLTSNPEIIKETIEEHTFTKIIIPGMGTSGSIGNPELPAWRRYIELPSNATNVSLAYEEQTLPEELKIQYPLYPVQPPWEKREGVQKPKLTKNNNVYNSNEKQGEKVAEIEPFGNVRGKNLYQITYYPISYEPLNSKIYITKNLLLTIRWDTPKTFSSRDKKYFSKYIDDLWEPFILNSSPLMEKSESKSYNIPVGMLVIVASSFVGNSKLNEWVQWKTQRGFITTVENVANIGTNATAIRDYIKQAYTNWEVPPTFVVLVGDPYYIQAPAGSAPNNPITDLYYSIVDGDEYYTPDLWVGRISVSTSNQLENALNKILKYEKAQWTLPEPWYIKASFLTGSDNYSITEATHNYVVSNYFEPAEFISQKLYTVTYGATTSDVITAVNSGRGWIVYSGHGSDVSWADGPPISQSDINSFTNTVYPWVLSFACDTGQYAKPECFGETWQRVSAGGVGFVGSSVTSYWEEDDILEKSVIESFFSLKKTWTAGMILNGKLKFFNYYGNKSTTQRYFEMYNLLGDPSTEIWAGILQSPSITHGSGIDPNGLPFPVYIEWANAVISLSNSNTLLGAVRSNFGSNLVAFSPPGVIPIVKLTITGNPIVPYQTDLPVITGSDGTIQWDKPIYNGSSIATLVLADANLSGQGEIFIPVRSDSGDNEQIVLTETQISGFFEGNIQLTDLATGNNDGLLSVVHNGLITAEYYDELTESGSPHTITAESTTDIYPPQLLLLSIIPDIKSVDVQLETDENCSARFEYGSQCSVPFEQYENSLAMNTNHKFLIAGLSSDTEYTYRIVLTDIAGNEYSTNCDTFTTLHQPDYFTYYYTSDVVDTVPLSNHQIIFTPDNSSDKYHVCLQSAQDFPRTTKNSTPITIGDDAFTQIDFPLETYVYLYGVKYSRCYVGSNGYVTFTQGNDDYSESLEIHFSLPRISLMFDDLDPSKGGSISYQFDTDAFVVTFSSVPRYGTGEANIQLEMFYDGTISITWLNCVSSSFIAGLSAGEGIPPNFELSDFINYKECTQQEGIVEGIFGKLIASCRQSAKPCKNKSE
ncbi:MAG: C25 family cysteine peptidase, partial [Candidatus Hydrogenedens sp.]